MNFGCACKTGTKLRNQKQAESERHRIRPHNLAVDELQKAIDRLPSVGFPEVETSESPA
jgi:hypothetical protein